MASANFNREIVASDSNGKVRTYSLDDVINKDFEGPYDYNFNTAAPNGVSIEMTEKFGYVLSILPTNTEFELSIVVTRRGVADPDFAIANTMVTILETPVATFNTDIVSPSSKEQAIYDGDREQLVVDGKFNEYVLDEVIDKNFPGPYKYSFLRFIDSVEDSLVGINFPKGLEIIENRKGQQVLLVGPNIEFELSIIVTNENKIEATATTMITIDGKPNFNKIKEEFYVKSNFGRGKEESAKVWDSIISERISSGDLIEGPVRPR